MIVQLNIRMFVVVMSKSKQHERAILSDSSIRLLQETTPQGNRNRNAMKKRDRNELIRNYTIDKINQSSRDINNLAEKLPTKTIN